MSSDEQLLRPDEVTSVIGEDRARLIDWLAFGAKEQRIFELEKSLIRERRVLFLISLSAALGWATVAIMILWPGLLP